MAWEKRRIMGKGLTGMGGHSGLYPGECCSKITLQAARGSIEYSGEFRWEAIPIPRRDNEV